MTAKQSLFLAALISAVISALAIIFSNYDGSFIIAIHKLNSNDGGLCLLLATALFVTFGRAFEKPSSCVQCNADSTNLHPIDFGAFRCRLCHANTYLSGD